MKKYKILGNKKIYFSDKKVILNAIKKKIKIYQII